MMAADIPETWQMRSVESVCTRVTTGGTPSRRRPDFYVNGTIPWFKTGELKDRLLFDSKEHITEEALESSSAKVFPANTVLMAMYGDGDTITKLGVLCRPAATNQACCAMMPDPDTCDWRYLFYALKHTRPELLRVVVGGAQRNLSGTIIRQHKFPLPRLAEQQAIAAVLGALDDKIELNRRMNATLEAMARALFQSWFVDFDPVRAKLDGRQPEGIDHNISKLLPNTFETTENGVVPVGWKYCPLTEVYDVSSGLSKPRAEFGFGHPFLTFTNVMNNVFIPERLPSLVNSSDADRSRCTVERGDVFLTRTSETQDELGMSSAALRSYPQATFNGFTKRLRSRVSSPLPPEYSGFYFRSAKFRQDVTAMSSLSTRASLNNEMLSRLQILVPPLLLCKAFEANVSPLLQRIQTNDVESIQLATLRDTLLPKLLSGELRIN